MSTSRTMPGGVAEGDLPKGPNGRTLCRYCNLEVPPRRRTFCGPWCVHEWKIRTNPGYLREQIWNRDKGICALCGVDTQAAWIALKRARGARRVELLVKWGLKKMNRRTLWDADHIVPVAEGGGECGLENMRTLCLRCHREQTLALRSRLRAKSAGNGV